MTLSDGAADNAEIALLKLEDTDPGKTRVAVNVKSAGGDGETSIMMIVGSGLRTLDARFSDLVASGIELGCHIVKAYLAFGFFLAMTFDAVLLK